MKRKEQRESSGAGRGGANSGRGGRGASSNRGGGVVARAPVKQIGRSYQQTLQTVSEARKGSSIRSS